MVHTHTLQGAVLLATILSLASSAGGQLAVPTGELTAPRRARDDPGQILDCNWHAVWRAPAGWRVAQVDGDVLTWSPDRTAVLVRTSAQPKRLGYAQQVARRLSGGRVVFARPTVAKRNKYRTTTTLGGTAALSGAPVEVLIEQHWRGYGKDLVWVQIAAGEERTNAWRLMATARSSELALSDHACQCGNDCSTREQRRRYGLE